MSTPKKVLGKGTIVKLGPADPGTTTVFGRIETANLPTREYEEVQAPELNPVDDSGAAIDNDPVELGDEILGEVAFTQYWDPQDTDALQIDTWFGAKTELVIEFETPHATGATISCNGKIKRVSPQQLTKQGYFKRDVVLNRTSAITNAATA